MGNSQVKNRKIREDIYPFIRHNVKKQQILQEFAKLTFETFKDLFPSKDDAIEYINNFEKPIVVEQFHEIVKYWHFAKFYYCPKCFPPKRIEDCPNCKNPIELHASFVLIMMLSIMELLSSDFKEFVDFYDWVSKKAIVKEYQTLSSGEINGLKEVIQSLKQRWSKEYGSITKVTAFFKKFLTNEEKAEFVKSIRYVKKVPELPPTHMGSIEGKTGEEALKMLDEWKKLIEKEQQILFKNDEDVKAYVTKNKNKQAWQALPICFDEEHYWECYCRRFYGQGVGYCHYVYDCRLSSDNDFLEDCFIKTVKTIYDWRSLFVHNAKFAPITETAILGGYYKNKQVIIELTTTELKPIFERMLKQFFDQYQKRKKRQL